mmetsp:Transcript_15314/g.27112  ORF Transcript_15314/g.27112 Transcript_15314/m.27112 type:complete len:99 (-) Transcript_15314:378-674(-)|eukprot:CAMPEP_0177753138 /NCGR_PEP_ID=MMETSP0491_2-20121128/1293_1 /TAXON_ID=63592 /ORGANISM="Tetraselmis chuii, Strain PLY429" /LENGTH=98 /DNA_ID=CAMNT_0019268389 /DNA_START=297 /DNA_END=593 /DNA_ORIENTATION=-
MSMNKLQIQLKKKEAERKKAAGQKSATSKEDKAKQDANKNAHMCSICRQTFMVNAKAKQLEGHVASKHAKASPEECFPELPAMRADEASGGGGKSKKK